MIVAVMAQIVTMFRRSPGAKLAEGSVVGDIAVVLPIPKFAGI
jgi:hypothetical protein